MNVVVFGAGRIGCASIGLALSRAGHDVTFVNRDVRIAERINQHGGYLVIVGENGAFTRYRVRGVRALRADDREAVIASIARAGLVATAVGVRNLPLIAGTIAAGLAGHPRSANVVAFENAADAGPRLHALVTRSASTGRMGRHGFAGGMAMRIVADRSLALDPAEPLTFLADRDDRLIVDRTGLTDDLPRADGLSSVGAYPGWIRAKLFTLNAAHAAAGYLGYLKGYRYVHAAVRDPQVRHTVREVATLGRDGIAAHCPTAILPDPDVVIGRLDNAVLNDRISRVARDPLRKLGRTERLAGAARWATDAGLDATPLALVIAAAIRYARDQGLGGGDARTVLRDVCGLDPDEGTGRLAVDHALRMASVPAGALSLDLSHMSWAWRAGRMVQPDAA